MVSRSATGTDCQHFVFVRENGRFFHARTSIRHDSVLLISVALALPPALDVDKPRRLIIWGQASTALISLDRFPGGISVSLTPLPPGRSSTVRCCCLAGPPQTVAFLCPSSPCLDAPPRSPAPQVSRLFLCGQRHGCGNKQASSSAITSCFPFCYSLSASTGQF